MTVYRTPDTHIDWSDLQSWRDVLVLIGRSRASARRARQLDAHLGLLPIELIYSCSHEPTLRGARALVIDPSFGNRPQRGWRKDAPHTPIIMAINNRLAQLAAAPTRREWSS